MRGETITITRQGAQTGEDTQGNPTYATSTIDVKGCAFAPASSDESGDTFGGRILSGGTVYAPAGTVFLPSDVLTIRGNPWHIDGEAGEWRSPFTNRVKGVEVAVKRGA
jgi:hypothetical protein